MAQPGPAAPAPVPGESPRIARLTLGGGFALARALDVPLKRNRVTVVGAFRSGTNYLAKLLVDNTRMRVRYHTFGWKHGPLDARGRKPFPGSARHRVLSISKDPFGFLVSFHRYIQEKQRNVVAPADWPDFVTGPIEIFEQGAPGSARFRFPNPVAYWNFLYAHHALLPADTFVVSLIRYDDLLGDPQGTIRTVFAEQGLPVPSRIEVPVNRLAASREQASALRRADQGGQPFDPSYHSRREYLSRFDPALSAFVRDQADPFVLDALGYTGLMAELAAAAAGGDR